MAACSSVVNAVYASSLAVKDAPTCAGGHRNPDRVRLGGFAPTISAAILKEGPEGWIPVAIFTTATAVIAAISAATARETYQVHLNDLGKKDAFPAPA